MALASRGNVSDNLYYENTETNKHVFKKDNQISQRSV